MEVLVRSTSKINIVFIVASMFLLPNIFMASTFVNKQMQA